MRLAYYRPNSTTRAPTSRTRARLRTSCAAAALFLLAGVAAGCGNSAEPTSFNDQVQGRNVVEHNYVEACKNQAAQDRIARVSDISRICECAWARVEAEITFEDFRELDSRLRGDPSRIDEGTGLVLKQIMAACINQFNTPA